MWKGERAMQQTNRSGAAVGWTAFAGVMMILIGVWWIFAGLVGLINDNFYVKTKDYIFQFNTTTWGWIHLIVGAIVLLAGFGVFAGAVWARTIGVIMAVVTAVVSFAWLPWYPLWALLIAAASITVIWALTAHGRDIAEP